MDRRSFLLGLCGIGSATVAGTAVLGPLMATPAAATPLDALRTAPVPGVEPAEAYGAAPDGTPADETYWVWRNGRRYWVTPPRRRRRRVCQRVRVPGGWRTRCFWR